MELIWIGQGHRVNILELFERENILSLIAGKKIKKKEEFFLPHYYHLHTVYEAHHSHYQPYQTSDLESISVGQMFSAKEKRKMSELQSSSFNLKLSICFAWFGFMAYQPL